MKIELDYNPSTGEIKDPRYGSVLITWLGLEPLEVKTLTSESSSNKVSVAELKELKEAGYEAHEITELRRTGVI